MWKALRSQMVLASKTVQIGAESSIFSVLASNHDDWDLSQPGIIPELTNLECLPVLKFVTAPFHFFTKISLRCVQRLWSALTAIHAFQTGFGSILSTNNTVETTRMKQEPVWSRFERISDQIRTERARPYGKFIGTLALSK